jgi:hypothetical protein
LDTARSAAQRSVRIVSSRLPRLSNSSADVRASRPVLRSSKADARTPASVMAASMIDNQIGVPVELSGATDWSVPGEEAG